VGGEAPREETTAMNPKSHSENGLSNSTIGQARPAPSWNHPKAQRTLRGAIEIVYNLR